MLLRTVVLLVWAVAFFHPAQARAAGPFAERAVVLAELSTVISADTTVANTKEPERLVAAVLAVTLGPFGAHRLYFGTSAKVPIIYGLTFGGFGVLVVIDLAHILFTKDLAAYERNGNVFMWAKPATPP